MTTLPGSGDAPRVTEAMLPPGLRAARAAMIILGVLSVVLVAFYIFFSGVLVVMGYGTLKTKGPNALLLFWLRLLMPWFGILHLLFARLIWRVPRLACLLSLSLYGMTKGIQLTMQTHPIKPHFLLFTLLMLAMLCWGLIAANQDTPRVRRRPDRMPRKKTGNGNTETRE